MIIELMTMRFNVQKYVDFIKPKVTESQKPQMLEFSDVKFIVSKLSDLDTNEKTNLKFLIERYRLALQTVAKKSNALKLLNTHIIFNIDRIHLMHLTEMITIYQKLNILKKRLVSTNRVRKIEMTRRYKEFQKALKFQNFTQ